MLEVMLTTLVLVPFVVFLAWLVWFADALWRCWVERHRWDDDEWRR